VSWNRSRGAGYPSRTGTLYSSACLHLERARAARSAGDIDAARKLYDAARCALNESRSMGSSTKLREVEEELAALDAAPTTIPPRASA